MAQESIFSFFAYKRYLEAYFKQKPKGGRGFLTLLAKHIDMTSAQLSHVMRGDRDLTFEQALKATKFIGLNQIEAQYFLEMVMFARAGTKDLKDYSKERLEQLKAEGLKLKNQVPVHRELTDAEKAKFYSSWIYSAVRLFSSIRPIQVEDVMTEFNLSRRRASEVLNFLVETSLCAQTDKGVVMGTRTTFVPRSSPFVFKHHSNWRRKALDIAEDGKESDLFFTSPVSLSQADFEKLKLRMTEVIKDFSSVVKESPEEIVACLNIDFFFVTEKSD